jgi:hypothetical protein
VGIEARFFAVDDVSVVQVVCQPFECEAPDELVVLVKSQSMNIKSGTAREGSSCTWSASSVSGILTTGRSGGRWV